MQEMKDPNVCNRKKKFGGNGNRKLTEVGEGGEEKINSL